MIYEKLKELSHQLPLIDYQAMMMAAAFSVSGRESEVSDGELYSVYKENSRRNFSKFFDSLPREIISTIYPQFTDLKERIREVLIPQPDARSPRWNHAYVLSDDNFHCTYP